GQALPLGTGGLFLGCQLGLLRTAADRRRLLTVRRRRPAAPVASPPEPAAAALVELLRAPAHGKRHEDHDDDHRDHDDRDDRSAGDKEWHRDSFSPRSLSLSIQRWMPTPGGSVQWCPQLPHVASRYP